MLTRERVPRTAGVFVTLSDFTDAAKAEAKQLGLSLINGVELFQRVEKVRRPEACPICGSAMILDRSRYGWWFRCTVPGCAGKRDLGRDPALAVDLLTQPPS